MVWKTESGWYISCGIHEFPHRPNEECWCCRTSSDPDEVTLRTVLGEDRRTERITYSTNPRQIRSTQRKREKRELERMKKA